MSVPLLISFSFGIKPSKSGGLRTISVLDESRFVTMCVFGREEIVALVQNKDEFDCRIFYIYLYI